MKTDKTNLNIIISIILFMIISIFSIYTTRLFLKEAFNNLYLKQLIFYIIGSFIIIFTTFKGFNLLKKYHLIIYIGINILLLSLLLFGISINGSKCWLFIGPFSFQPSELMKISLIITLSVIISKFKHKKNKSLKDEFILILKLLILTLIPSILTFLEPDTGVVIIYFLIFITMFMFLNLNKKWYLISFFIILFFTSSFIFLYFFERDLFLNIVGDSIFYRLDRILNWANTSGYQLENSLIAIGASGLTGFGFNKSPVYFPEPQTDFIFATFTSNFGLLGASFLIFIILIFDTTILRLVTKKVKLCDKYIILGIFIMLFYGQVQNISMTIGLLPITGIPLPFISYGGTSLLSYLFVVGMILNINKERFKYRN
ncbi:MAG: FtsW/RodA/SpoVE family cell cycle protein [Bacilli bacterium]|nr:FtsW/RodA/SpoVE family cell cycle protein [Bacilli bacterium]